MASDVELPRATVLNASAAERRHARQRAAERERQARIGYDIRWMVAIGGALTVLLSIGLVMCEAMTGHPATWPSTPSASTSRAPTSIAIDRQFSAIADMAARSHLPADVAVPIITAASASNCTGLLHAEVAKVDGDSTELSELVRRVRALCN